MAETHRCWEESGPPGVVVYTDGVGTRGLAGYWSALAVDRHFQGRTDIAHSFTA